MNRIQGISLLVFIILLIDQIVKIYVKTHFYLGEEILVLGDWFRLYFIENNGMAFGLSFGGKTGKLVLSVFRITAIVLIAYYILYLHKKGAKTGLLVSIALIFSGALGNVIDSAFYGMIFSDVYHYGQLSTLFPEEGGYAPFLFGRVVDIFYFPILDFYFPDNFPIWGGKHFVFFRPVFNIADASITTGVFSILFFYRSFLIGSNQDEPSVPGNFDPQVKD